jgi:hypothetical protein
LEKKINEMMKMERKNAATAAAARPSLQKCVALMLSLAEFH